jgi:hypothetical protein
MATQTLDIEFTDRYGGHAPSWLRGCFRCDAMGCYPEPPASARNADGTIDISPGVDDWEFVVCPECHGTARVSWWRTLMRIPRWLVKGIPFVLVAAPHFWQGHKRRLPAMWNGFQCAYLADLGLYDPNQRKARRAQ